MAAAPAFSILLAAPANAATPGEPAAPTVSAPAQHYLTTLFTPTEHVAPRIPVFDELPPPFGQTPFNQVPPFNLASPFHQQPVFERIPPFNEFGGFQQQPPFNESGDPFQQLSQP
jgi:hypothetical protein